jgi:hypothetical protein
MLGLVFLYIKNLLKQKNFIGSLGGAIIKICHVLRQSGYKFNS